MPVHQTVRFLNDPKLAHEQSITWIGQYLLGTKEKGIKCKIDQSKGLECYVDADFAGECDITDPHDNSVMDATVKWCPHHGTGAYMPNNHNHAEWWLEKKKKCNAKWAEGHSNKRVKFSDETKAKANMKPAASKEEKHPTKLQLASSSSIACHPLLNDPH